MPAPTISPELAQLWHEIKAAQASAECRWHPCGRFGRHLIPDWGNFCDRHLAAMRNQYGRDFGYRVSRGRMQRYVKVDMWADGDIEYGTAAE